MQKVEGRVDGRSARALRTREAIVDACVSLVEEGELRPTAPRVAERAGVSVRSLHIAVTERISERVGALLHPVDVGMPFEERIDVFVRHRALLLEAITPFRRAANVHGPFAPEIRHALRQANQYMHNEVARGFGPELDQITDDTTRREVLDGLSTTLSWAAWDALRTDSDRSVAESTAVTMRVVRALLSELANLPN